MFIYPSPKWKPILTRLAIAIGTLGAVGGVGTVAISFLLNSISCGDMWKYHQGESYANSMNRAQQAFYLENGRFAAEWESLQIEGEKTTFYYRLLTKVEEDMALSYALVREPQLDDSREAGRDREELFTTVGAVAPLTPELQARHEANEHNVDSMVWSTARGDTDSLTQAIVCKAEQPGLTIPPAPQLVDGILRCAEGSS